MAQTNDETFLKKGLSKTNYEIISELGFRADYDGEIRIALNKARLAALDDIKPCIKAFENLLNAIQEDAAETECCKFNIKGEDSMCEIHSAFKKADKALAELEALRKKVEK